MTSAPNSIKSDSAKMGIPDESGRSTTMLPDRPRLPWRRCIPLVTLLVLTTAAWLALFLQRVHAHQPNVDDYYYAYLAH